MTNSMLFEGPILEDVLNEARQCFGEHVEIEAANRVRRGGVMGFFASEWYEVWAGPSATAPTSSPALSLLEGEEDPDSFQQMVRNAIDEDRRLGRDVEPAAMAASDESALDRFFGAASAPDPAPVSEPESVGVAVGTIDLSSRADTTTSAARTPAPAMAAAAPAAAAGAATAGAATAAPPISLLPDGTVSASVALEDPPRGDSVFAEPRAQKTDLLWAMLNRLETLPSAPALPESGLVVFVGEAAAALETARRIGARHDLWNGDVAVLGRSREIAGVPSWLVIDDPAEFVARAARWRQRGGVFPVVIDQGVEAVDRAWTARVVAAMEAEQVRLVAEAWRLPEDVGRLAGKLGGVDALEVVAVSDSVEPLALLDLDIPLSSIEGRPATPELLAAVWLENRRRG